MDNELLAAVRGVEARIPPQSNTEEAESWKASMKAYKLLTTQNRCPPK